jgi:hypothetical protein
MRVLRGFGRIVWLFAAVRDWRWPGHATGTVILQINESGPTRACGGIPSSLDSYMLAGEYVKSAEGSTTISRDNDTPRLGLEGTKSQSLVLLNYALAEGRTSPGRLTQPAHQLWLPGVESRSSRNGAMRDGGFAARSEMNNNARAAIFSEKRI